jgi:hypothetical protein
MGPQLANSEIFAADCIKAVAHLEIYYAPEQYLKIVKPRAFDATPSD